MLPKYFIQSSPGSIIHRQLTGETNNRMISPHTSDHGKGKGMKTVQKKYRSPTQTEFQQRLTFNWINSKATDRLIYTAYQLCGRTVTNQHTERHNTITAANSNRHKNAASLHIVLS
jgi:hypothetical protein